MYQLLFMLILLFIFTLLYTYAISRFTHNKLALFFPSIIVLIWYFLQWSNYLKYPTAGFEGLSIYFASLIVPIVLFANLFFGFIFLKKQKK